jgi:hypothetical protein
VQYFTRKTLTCLGLSWLFGTRSQIAENAERSSEVFYCPSLSFPLEERIIGGHAVKPIPPIPPLKAGQKPLKRLARGAAAKRT